MMNKYFLSSKMYGSPKFLWGSITRDESRDVFPLEANGSAKKTSLGL